MGAPSIPGGGPVRSRRSAARRSLLVGLAVALLSAAFAAGASPIDALDPEREWLVAAVAIEGHHALPTSAIRRVVETETRGRLRFWRKRPVFDQTVVERDAERIARLYETEGYYRTKVAWRFDVRHTARAEILTVVFGIDEGPRAMVDSIEIVPPDPTLVPSADSTTKPAAGGKPGVPRFALAVGDPFREVDYQRFESQLRAAYLDRGFASVETRRSARIRPDRLGVTIRYEIVPGPPARFGPVSIEGLQKVSSRIVQRELTFATGDPFSFTRIEESRRRIQALDLFASIQIDWKTDPASPEAAPITIVLHEKKARELRIGGGFSTEERGRAHVRWQNRNFLGGGRRLLVAGRYSNLVRSAELSFSQPHFFDRNNRGLFEFALFQQDEPNFTRNSIQGVPAFERRFTRTFTATAGVRVDTAVVRDVEEEVRTRIGGVRDEGTVIGPRIALRWTPVDDVARPRDGLVASFEAQYSTRHFGASYDYVRFVGEVAVFQPVFDWAVVAGRLKLGAAQAFGSPERLPIFERFYAGGEGSVRGYRRHQLGPTANNGNPLGGRSLIEGSLEARIPVWRNIGAVGFVDFGQVSLERYDFVPDELRFAAGPGLSYATPIGPISLFAGFPINRQSGEPPWQMHFNIGFFF
ncbi:MAG: BamA/TamA family outer membrane protein [Deltaproteobacteria bacterium]|nr:BamA/TamA family outer membrane protein [Deltaproteobacteria bacterium]